jgi:hypothetical protein
MRSLLALSLSAACLIGPQAAEAKLFQSPTGNIGCSITRQGVRCDIARHTWPTPPKPRSCEVDYGQGVAVGKRGRASFVCAGDTALNQGPVLDYGKRIRRGRFRCRSRTDGMRCVNRRNGHGFFLSRARVDLF